eukprot:13250308-Ditylum_brightwellii.AAC.1
MLWDNLSTMLKAKVSYCCQDYLQYHKVTPLPPLDLDCGVNPKMKLLPSSKQQVDESCHEQICEWCYCVADYFCIGREVMAAAMLYLNLYLSLNVNCNQHAFKLAATTALYI